MLKLDWEGPHPGEPSKRIYTRGLIGFDYNPSLNSGIATLASLGVSLGKAQRDPYEISREVLAYSGLRPFQLLDDFIVIQVAQLPSVKTDNLVDKSPIRRN